MAQFVASKVGKILAERALDDIRVKKFDINGKNPYEEQIPVLGNDGRPTRKTKTRKRPIPTNLSQNDARVLKRVRHRAYRLDMSLFNCCGIRFGWSSVVAIIPVIGDFLDAFMALMVVRLCQKVDGGIPQQLRARMIFNILVDFGIGLVPILGDIADAVFRANTRNAWLLETYLVKKAEAERTGGVTDPESGKTLPAAPQPAATRPAGIENGGGGGGGGDASNGGRFGRFLGFGNKSDMPDEEMSVGVTNNGSHGLQQNGR